MVKDITQIFKGIGFLFVLYAFALYTSAYNNNVYFVFIFSVFSIITLPIRKYLDKTAIFLMLFSFTFVLISYTLNVNTKSHFQMLCHFISPLIFYVFGRYIVDKLNKKDLIIIFILVTLFLFTIGTILSIYKSILENGIVSLDRNISIDGENSVKAATLIGLLLSVNLAGIGIFIADKNRFKSLTSWIFLLLCICSLVCNMHMVNRTGIVLCAIVTVISIMYTNKKHFMKFIFILGALISLLWLLIENNIIGSEIIEAYEQRQEYDEINDRGITSERDVRWLFSLKQLFIHPFGWISIKHSLNDYAHNLWLDIARTTGLIPFTLMILASINCIKDLIYVAKQKADMYNILILSLLVIFLISLFIEPIIDGAPLYLYLFLFICGITRQSIIRKLTTT